MQHHALIGRAQVQSVDAALWAIHTATLLTEAVVQQFGRKTGEYCALRCLEVEAWQGGSILAEVDDEMFTLVNHHRFAILILATDDHSTVGRIRPLLHVLPNVGLHRLQGNILAQTNLRSV